MSQKHAELEREFIEDLLPRTGRTLRAWMTAIDGAGLCEKNAIIDWLRPQGFTFANASWLERIHNNGGRPIYIHADVRRPEQVPAASPVRPVPGTTAIAPAAKPNAPTPGPAASVQPLRAAASGAEQVAALMSRGKGLRPLAEMLLAEIQRAVPTATLVVDDDRLGIVNPAELAALLVSPRELRLALDLGDAPFEGLLVKARQVGANGRLTHMVVLTDARQVGPALIELVKRADCLSNSPVRITT